MKTLHLLRHAKSAWDDPELSDHERPLAPRGIRAATRMGRYLAATGFDVDLVLCSTARRAADTLAQVQTHLDSQAPVERERGLYQCGPAVLIERLRDLPDSAGSVLVVGHIPDLQEVALQLASGAETSGSRALAKKFPTAAIASLEFPTDHWRDLAPGSGLLIRFVKPKEIK
ncbi:MAG: histidine phosphatase family protein [Azospirillum sp.]|nr:histidine phosphatase family protein [Azospirillum sp.]